MKASELERGMRVIVVDPYGPDTEGGIVAEIDGDAERVEISFDGGQCAWMSTGDCIQPEHYDLDGLVLVETMPPHLRQSHRAAGNWGRYPHNGSERRVIRADSAPDGTDEYDSVVRHATRRDVARYGISEDTQ